MNEAELLSVIEPVPYHVYQRKGYDPCNAHVNCPGGPKLGSARVVLKVRCVDDSFHEWRFRIADSPDSAPGNWATLKTQRNGDIVTAEIDVKAGGWYGGEVEARSRSGKSTVVPIGPFGAGEVYIIAGQSYASNCNDDLTRVQDPIGRIAALDLQAGTWRIAHDPQPVVPQEPWRLGTIWPSAMSFLLSMVRVPIGMVNVAVGATTSLQWQQGTQLFANLETAGRAVGDFRAVLWQQGESDVMENVKTDEYTARIIAVKTELESRWGFSAPWIVAKSTLHPTVYCLPEREQAIRDAADRLWHTPGFFPGPDTDILGGENRSGMGGSRHFTLSGQRNASLLWFCALWSHLASFGVQEKEGR